MKLCNGLSCIFECNFFIYFFNILPELVLRCEKIVLLCCITHEAHLFGEAECNVDLVYLYIIRLPFDFLIGF